MPSTDTNNFPYIIRNYQPADFDKYVLLRREAEKLEPYRHPILSQAVAEIMARPDYSPERDLFVVLWNSSIIGWMDMVPELTIRRVLLNCWLRPEHRRKGIARRLVDFAIRRAGELGARVFHVNIDEKTATAGLALSRLGFECVRKFFEFKLDIAEFSCKEVERATQGCRHLRQGEEAELMRIQNRAFAEHWGYNPNTLAAINYQTSLSHFSPDDVVLACESGKVTGYCWTQATYSGEAGGGAEGQIYMLGVDPDCRGRKTGKILLSAGLAHLSDKGVKVAWLHVDSENKAACELYRSFGFEIRANILWYEMSLTQGTGAS